MIRPLLTRDNASTLTRGTCGSVLHTLLLIFLFAGCSLPGTNPAPTATPTARPFDPGRVSLDVELVLGGLDRPVFVTHAGDSSDRLFIVERGGTIRVAVDGVLLPEPFLDVTTLVKSSAGEQGLLGLAFHPQYERNGTFFVYYTAEPDGANTLARFRVSADPDRAERASRTELLAIPDDRGNHNGGMLAFGPDGFLYVATGDGGSGKGPNGQRRDVHLGKLLRLDVDDSEPYAIPQDNPYADTDDGLPEIWSFGLRNPWRFSFDRATGDLYIGDVGSVDFEEINFQPAGSDGGINYGWNITEGMHCKPLDLPCDTSGITYPVAEYKHADGCAVTGGYVYRGAAFPYLVGAYLYSDFCRAELWSLHRDATGAWVQTRLLGETELAISSFGEDEAGELYLTDMSEGRLFRVVDQAR